MHTRFYTIVGVKYVYLLGTSPVEEFETWKSSFQENESYRAEHGEIGYQVFRTVDDPNEIVVIFEWDENEDPRAFFQSEEMRERMADAGLTRAPDLTPIELVERKSSQYPSA